MKTKDEWLDDMELRLKRALLDVVDTDEADGLRFLHQEVTSHLEDISGDAVRFDYLQSLQERFPQLLPDETDQNVEELAYEPIQNSEPPSVEEALEIVRRDWDLLDKESREGFLQAVASETDHRDVAQMPKDAAPRDAAPRDAAPRDAAPRDAAPRDAAPRDAAPRDAAPRDSAPRERGESSTFESPSAELARFLKLPEDTPLSVERLQSAMIGLLKTVSQVDSLGTQVYKQLGMSRDLDAEDIRKLIGAHVSGNNVEVDQMNRVLNETRLKIGLIISSIGNLPSSLCQSHLTKFQPALIEQAVSGGGLLGGKEAKCWKKYVSLAEDIQPQKIEKAINDLMIKQLKRIKGR